MKILSASLEKLNVLSSIISFDYALVYPDVKDSLSKLHADFVLAPSKKAANKCSPNCLPPLKKG